MAGFEDFTKAVTSKYGQKRILSDRVRVSVKSEGKIVRIGEFDSFSATSRESLKTFKPAGETREISLIEPGGYDLSFSGGKVDWNLARLLHKQELFYHQRKPGETPKHLLTFFHSNRLDKVVHIAPKFQVEQTITYYNGSLEIYVYEDVTLFGYDINIDGDLGVVKESVKGHSPRKTRSNSTFILDETILPQQYYVIDNIIGDMLLKEDRSTPSSPKEKWSGSSNLG